MNRDITYCENKGCPLRSCCERNNDKLQEGYYSLSKFEYDYIHNMIVCEEFIEVNSEN